MGGGSCSTFMYSPGQMNKHTGEIETAEIFEILPGRSVALVLLLIAVTPSYLNF